MSSTLVALVETYYAHRDLKWPTTIQALMWAQTELAEVYELLLARDGGWVRNNPESKEAFSKERLAEELGDTIMMLFVAGIIEGVDPIAALKNKIESKMKNG